MAKEIIKQGTYKMNVALRTRIKKFMVFNNFETMPDAVNYLINDALDRNKIR